jgi:DNA-binding winged helix-turn-helix (wHTH) protein
MVVEILGSASSPVPIGPDEPVDRLPSTATADAALVIAVTRNVSTRVQLARQMPIDAVLVFAPDQAAVDRALHAGRPHGDGGDSERAPIAYGGLVIDPLTHRVTWLGTQLALTRLERRLLSCLIEPPLRVWPYELLYRTVWRQTWLGDTSTMHAIVKRLRRRLRDAGVTAVLESVRGVGFSLVLQPAEIAGGERPDASSLRSVGAVARHRSSSSAASRAATMPSWKRVTTP